MISFCCKKIAALTSLILNDFVHVKITQHVDAINLSSYFAQNVPKNDIKFDYSFDDSFSREEWLSCRAKLSSSQRGGATLLI